MALRLLFIPRIFFSVTPPSQVVPLLDVAVIRDHRGTPLTLVITVGLVIVVGTVDAVVQGEGGSLRLSSASSVPLSLLIRGSALSPLADWVYFAFAF